MPGVDLSSLKIAGPRHFREFITVSNDPGTLFVVATPIGNLDDISARARDVLAETDIVAAEDTRRAGQLLTRLGCRKKLISLHEHNESERVDALTAALTAGQNVALISDAGTPLISDPGYRLLAAARRLELPVSPIPGSCAAIAALSVAGLPSDRFRFEGFLPARTAGRKKRLAALLQCPDTLILYESVHRIRDLLADLEAVFGPDRPIMVGRELTKLHETLYRGSIAEVRGQLDRDPGADKGEVTVVIGGSAETGDPDRAELARVLEILLEDVSTRQAARLAARITGARRGDAYALAIELRGQSEQEGV
jgi:16S rRNA (cytidine1402-2'-O)-methyltransferase